MKYEVAYTYKQVMWNRYHNPAARKWWNLKCRQPVFERDGRLCTRCRKPSRRLVCHHTTYKDPVTGESIIGREDRFLHLLTTLCPYCHDYVHNKLWWQKMGLW